MDTRSAQILSRWLPRLNRESDELPFRISRRRIFVLPSFYGIVFGLMIIAMFVTGLNFNNSLVLLMSFLLGTLAMVSAHQAHRNLLGLDIHGVAVRDAHLGQAHLLRLRLSADNDKLRHDIHLRVGKHEQAGVVRGGESNEIVLKLPSERIGRQHLKRVGLETLYPFGLFRAWFWLNCEETYWTYPAPEQNVPPWPESSGASQQRRAGYAQRGDEEFDHIRNYRDGDPRSRIAWKVSARRGQWVSKAFAGTPSQQLRLRWTDTSGNTDRRLSRLCSWVLQAEKQGLRYALELDRGAVTSVGHGRNHQRACLRALAERGSG